MIHQFYKSIFYFSISLLLIACKPQPQPIEYDIDECHSCRMTISDVRFGAELVTEKGRVYKFDDLHCLKSFLEEGSIKTNEINSLWTIDFSDPGTFVPLEKSYLLQHEDLNSPMGSNIATFSIGDSAKIYQSKYSGNITKWEDYLRK